MIRSAPRHSGGMARPVPGRGATWWADPQARLVLGLAGLALSGIPVHDQSIGPREAALFHAVNRLPDGCYLPAWVIMQAGNLAAVPVAAGCALMTGHRRLAARVALAGTATWALSKLIKDLYRRPRPPALVQDARSRGPEPSGLGYVSGHAGVAVALGVATWAHLNTSGRLASLVVVPAVGLCRIYVGAHLPLDVAGGAALGLSADAVFARLLPAERASMRSVGSRLEAF